MPPFRAGLGVQARFRVGGASHSPARGRPRPSRSWGLCALKLPADAPRRLRPRWPRTVPKPPPCSLRGALGGEGGSVGQRGLGAPWAALSPAAPAPACSQRPAPGPPSQTRSLPEVQCSAARPPLLPRPAGLFGAPSPCRSLRPWARWLRPRRHHTAWGPGAPVAAPPRTQVGLREVAGCLAPRGRGTGPCAL